MPEKATFDSVEAPERVVTGITDLQRGQQRPLRQPDAVFGSATFGRIRATNTTLPNMRQLQLGGKLIF
jgi:hypothetical protein